MFEHAVEGCPCAGHQCTKCKKVKCRGFFRSRKDVKSGLQSHCHQCEIEGKRVRYSPEKRRTYYEAHIDYEQERNREYAREHKEEVKARNRERYNQNREYESQRRKRRHQQNKEYENQRQRAWYQANHERALVTGKAWRQENSKHHNALRQSWRLRNIERFRANLRNWRNAVPGRISAQHSKRRAYKVQAGGSYDAIEWENLKAKYAYTCLCCGRREPDIKLTADHVMPVSKGGTSFIENIQPLCKSCNSSKGTRIIDYRLMWKEKEA